MLRADNRYSLSLSDSLAMIVYYIIRNEDDGTLSSNL